MKILFICKYNRFRSKVAEAYFKRINKDKRFKIKSAGVIKVGRWLDDAEKRRNVYLEKQFGFKLDSRFRGISVKNLLWADKIIVVADDLPMPIFNSKKWKNKVEIWKVPDEKADNKRNINKIVKLITGRVENLIKILEKK